MLNTTKAPVDLERTIFFLQIVAWRELESRRRIPSNHYFSKVVARDFSLSRLFEVQRKLAAKYPMMQFDEEVLQSTGNKEIFQIVTDTQRFDAKSLDLSTIETFFSSIYGDNGGFKQTACELVKKLSEVGESSKVLCSGHELLAFQFAQKSNSVTIIDSEHPVLCHLLNFLLGTNVRICSLGAEPGIRKETFQLLIADFSQSRDYYEGVWFAFEQLDANRKILLVPNRFFTRSASEDLQLRKDLLVSGNLEAVISLPALLTGPQKQPCSLLLLNRTRSRKTDDILFLDASSKSFVDSATSSHANSEKDGPDPDGLVNLIVSVVKSRVNGPNSIRVSPTRCKDEDFNFSPKLYLRQKSESSIVTFLDAVRTRDLSEIADLLRPQALREFVRVGDGDKYFEVSVSDIAENGCVVPPKKKLELYGWFAHRHRNMILRQGDILLAIKGAVGKVGIVVDDSDANWLANQSLMIVRLRKGSGLGSPVVLYQYLSSFLGQSQIQYYAEGNSFPFLQISDLRQLRIPIPSDENQKEIVSRFEKASRIFQRIEKLRQEVTLLNGNAFELFK